jgi:hypothetical protein
MPVAMDHELHVFIPRDLYVQLSGRAKAEDRPMSGLVRQALRIHFNNNDDQKDEGAGSG